MVRIVRLAAGLNGRWGLKIPSMTRVWALNVPDAGAGHASSIENRVSHDQRKPLSGAVICMLDQSREPFRWACTCGRVFWDDPKAPAHQRQFWLRNEPYALTDPRSPLISQQMRPPSERTIRHKLLMRRVFPHSLLAQSHSLPKSYSQQLHLPVRPRALDQHFVLLSRLI